MPLLAPVTKAVFPAKVPLATVGSPVAHRCTGESVTWWDNLPSLLEHKRSHRMGSPVASQPLEPLGFEAVLEWSGHPSAETAEALGEVYARDGLVLIRGLALSMDEQLDLCSLFGPVMRESIENYFVSNVRPDGLLGTRELLFHNDISYVTFPYVGGSLHAVEIEPGASPTRFASGFRAYERLPVKLRKRVEGLTALHVRERVEGRRSRLSDMLPGDTCAAHRLVRHRESDGRPFLFVNQSLTAQIVGLSEAQSDALLEELFGYLYAEGTVYQHSWRVGDIVIWDNLGIQHARAALTPARRTLQRVTLASVPYRDQYPLDREVYTELRTFAELADQP
jgi:taurine dioxygenase